MLTMRAVALGLFLANLAMAQEPEVVVSKDSISIHRVERGSMPLREITTGTITSTAPARATVRLTSDQSASVRVGQPASVQVVAPAVVHGTVIRVGRDSLGEITADIQIADSLAPSTTIGARLGALIDVGTMNDVVYFERPATARPNTESTIFVLEPDGKHAKRVPVGYGRLSGSQLQIVSGISPGDLVIVTELPGLTGRSRVALK
jgi:hypothetical protein